MNISEEVAKYLSSATSVQAFYNEIPDDTCPAILVQAVPTSYHVPVQVNASINRLQISAKHLSNTTCYELIMELFHAMQKTHGSNEDETGIINLNNNLSCSVEFRGSPVWSRSDQKGRKYFVFEIIVTTKNL